MLLSQSVVVRPPYSGGLEEVKGKFVQETQTHLRRTKTIFRGETRVKNETHVTRGGGG